MDWLAFAAALISSLAWPVAVVIAAIIFRKPLIALSERINALKVPGGLEVGLGHALAKGQESSERVALERAEESGNSALPMLSSAEARLANEYPAAALEKFYKDAEARLFELRMQIPDKRRGRSLNEVVKWLFTHGHITKSVHLLWLSIKNARADALRVAGPGGISAYDAVTFGTQVKQFLQALESIKFTELT